MSFAHAMAQSVDAYTLTAGRLWATSAALLGLVGAVVGGQALARSRRRTGTGAFVALGSGLVAMVGGGVNLAVADGGPGTGNGVVGGALALMVGLLAMIFGGLALARSRRGVRSSA
jgi:hypothetical protein